MHSIELLVFDGVILLLSMEQLACIPWSDSLAFMELRDLFYGVTCIRWSHFLAFYGAIFLHSMVRFSFIQ